MRYAAQAFQVNIGEVGHGAYTMQGMRQCGQQQGRKLPKVRRKSAPPLSFTLGNSRTGLERMEIFLFWLGIAIITGIAAASRGRSGFGWFLLGCIFSILAFLAVLVMPSRKGDPNAPTPETHVRCPECAELVLAEAKVCKHCGVKLVPNQNHRAMVAQEQKSAANEETKNLVIGVAFVAAIIGIAVAISKFT
jgi:hypothetical protein